MGLPGDLLVGLIGIIIDLAGVCTCDSLMVFMSQASWVAVQQNLTC
jgi:hypothetical protein